jgi:tRNA(Leu) C34 or U34 (ribose-2'-O)-methylase TrmL
MTMLLLTNEYREGGQDLTSTHTLLQDFDLGAVKNVSKDKKIFDETMAPSIILYNPKYAHNLGAAVRAASCFGAKAVLFTGDRVVFEPSKGKGKYRLPREERMKGYKDVEILKDEYPLNRFSNITPVAVEMRDNSEPLPIFQHPENAVYMFGPEDGSIPQVMLRHCHRFIVIPSKHCVNLSAAVYLVLYDRIMKKGIITIEDMERESCQTTAL